MSALDAVLRRRSHARVTADAPTHEQLILLVTGAATVADHGALRPWRLIELRGAARERLGAAFVAESGLVPDSADAVKLAAKPLRASLLIAVVAIHEPSIKVPEWEQDAAASGIAHMLSLLLDESGWGVFWRSGPATRSDAVHRMHQLASNEKLLGWLYVGGVIADSKLERKREFTVERHLTELADLIELADASSTARQPTPQ